MKFAYTAFLGVFQQYRTSNIDTGQNFWSPHTTDTYSFQPEKLPLTIDD